MRAIALVAGTNGLPPVMTDALVINREAIRDKFRQWDEAHHTVATQLSESLAALSALQSHLDAWQRELARERDELRAAREQFVRDQSAAEQSQTRVAEVSDELNASRDKISALTAMLLSRTEELRVLDNRRAETVTELELSRAREKELKASFEELKQTREQERAQWSAETLHLRELLERRIESADAPHHAAQTNTLPTENRPERPKENRTERHTESQATENPVFASVMEQFGKLRQQRAQDRPALKKVR